MTYNWPLVDICLFCMFGQQKTGSEGTSFLGEHNFYRVLCSLALQPWASYLTSLCSFSHLKLQGRWLITVLSHRVIVRKRQGNEVQTTIPATL